MKRVLILFTILFVIILCIIGVHADTNKLTINFEQNDVQFKVYDISKFDSYNIDYTDSDLTTYLVSLINRDKIVETTSGTIKNNTLTINLPVGCYLVTADNFVVQNEVYSMMPSIVKVENNVSIKPKFEKNTLEQFELSVLKTWKDDKNTHQEISVTLYENGSIKQTIKLNSSNSFKYTFKNLDRKNTYSVFEDKIPSGYKLKIIKSGDTFNLINDSDNVVSIMTIKGDKGIVAREKFERIGPNYYIQNDEIEFDSLIYQPFSTILGWRAAYKYEKAVCLASLGNDGSNVPFSYIASLCDLYPHVCYVNMGNGWWKVIDPNITSSHADTYVKVFIASSAPTDFEVKDCCVQAPDGSIAYVGYDKPFSFNAREWFVLRKDGFVYTHNPIRVETFYIDNHEICHKMNCVNVDAIPSFVLAEEVPYLTLSEDEPSRDDVKYEVNISNDERRPFVYGSSEVNGGGSIVIDGTPHPFEASNGQMVILDDVGVVESVNDIRVSTDVELILRLE